MRRPLFEWSPRPPSIGERVVVGVWLGVFLVLQASYFAGWHVVGDYDKQAVDAVGLLGTLLVLRMMALVKRT